MSSLATLRSVAVRPIVAVLALLPFVLAACSEVGTANLTFWDVVFSMIAFFFWFMFIWIFISIFGDIFRRNDLSGGAKALWVLALVFLPFLGALIYLVARPKLTAQDVESLTMMDAANKAASSVTPTDQIAKLAELRASGAITEEEYTALKAKAMG